MTDALARGYVRSVAFALMRSRASGGGNGDLGDGRTRTGVRDDAETVEEYKFNVRYGSRGECDVDDARRDGRRADSGRACGLTEGTGKTTRLERLYDIDYIKRAAISMTRCLLSLVKTRRKFPTGARFRCDWRSRKARRRITNLRSLKPEMRIGSRHGRKLRSA